MNDARQLQYFGDVDEATGEISRNLSKRMKFDIANGFRGQRVEITIKRKRKTRSQNQNRYYWGVIVEFFREGALCEWQEVISKDQAHEALKMQCLSKEQVNRNTGEVIRVPMSTRFNNTLDQEEYHERCRAFIQEWFNIEVPLPNTQASLDFER